MRDGQSNRQTRSLAASYGFYCACIALLLVLYGCGSLERFYPAHALRFAWWPGGAIEIPAGRFIALYLVAVGISLSALIAFPWGLSRRRAWMMIVLSALACRLFVLPYAPTDDVNRYLWEGRLVANGLSPYEHAPIASHDPEADEFRSDDDPYWSKINHPTMTAIYPPAPLLLFAAVSTLWYDPLAVKILMLGFDLAALLLILYILEMRALPERWALLYAISPLIVYSFAGRGHLDAIEIFFLLGALLAYQKKSWPLMFLSLACAVQGKYIAAIAFPFFLRRDNLRYAWLFPFMFALPFLPFLSEGIGGVFRSLTVFAESFAFNGAIHGLLLWATGSLEWAAQASLIGLAIVLLVGLWTFHPERRHRRDPDPTRGVFFVLAAFLLFSPTVHFWYVAMIVPFIVFRPTASWVVLSASIGFSTVAEGIQHQTGAWAFPLWAQMLVWIPPAVLLCRDGRLAWGRLWRRRLRPTPKTVSVVIPCVNEAQVITECIESLWRSDSVAEVIVVDGGSRDGSAELAQKAGARVLELHRSVEAGGGRGGRIRKGARAAKGDVIVIVHADTRVDDGALDRVVHTLGKNPDFFGGALGARFGARGAKLRALEFANHLRAGFFGVSFGDQVQFFRNDRDPAGCLVPDIPLMEDVELAMRFHLYGRSAYLWGGSVASARRWRLGALSRMTMVLRLVSGYLLARVFGTPNTAKMYFKYYGRSVENEPSDCPPER